jgi:hypothetical protein
MVERKTFTHDFLGSTEEGFSSMKCRRSGEAAAFSCKALRLTTKSLNELSLSFSSPFKDASTQRIKWLKAGPPIPYEQNKFKLVIQYTRLT